MPCFSPLPYSFPSEPSKQTLRSLETYSIKEVLTLKKRKENFINVIQPGDKETRNPKKVHAAWMKFLQKGWYTKPPQKTFLYYKISSSTQETSGFLGGITTDDIQSHAITKHEKTYPLRVDLMTNYLEQVRIQAEPVMLLHESPIPEEICPSVLEKNNCDIDFEKEGNRHQLWTLNAQQSQLLSRWANKQSHFHLADGHHRTQSMVHLSKTMQKPLSILSFLVHQSQVQLYSFIWFSEEILNPETLSELEQTLTSHGAVPLKKAIKSNKTYPLVVKLDTHYYGFTKARIRTKNSPTFIITSLLNAFPALPKTLKYTPDLKPHSSEDLLIKQLVFYMEPLTKTHLIETAINQEILPAKSTFILPKMLTGMVVSSLGDN